MNLLLIQESNILDVPPMLKEHAWKESYFLCYTSTLIVGR
jgi:hypothetical protein